MDEQRDARERLRAWVKRQGGKRAAAKRIGCHPSYLVHLLGSEERRPGLDVAFAIERATAGDVLGVIRAEEWAAVREPAATGTEG